MGKIGADYEPEIFHRKIPDAEFKKLRNEAQYLVNKSKTNFFKDKLMGYKHDSKSLWKTLKTVGLPSKKSESTKSVGLKINDEICFDPLKVVETLILFFLNICFITG